MYVAAFQCQYFCGQLIFTKNINHRGLTNQFGATQR
ncbi:Uncharacterised protein [Vibrio cholerae]|nr:Uncharacterised protein [Vibrio cholerae]CSC57052.1 Uncharacterised protein [Vibrio cholerae]CSD03840.1 Uncharacterised protein [Vibrio cholerae]